MTTPNFYNKALLLNMHEWMNDLHNLNPASTCFIIHIFITIAKYTISPFSCINIRLPTVWPGNYHTPQLHSWTIQTKTQTRNTITNCLVNLTPCIFNENINVIIDARLSIKCISNLDSVFTFYFCPCIIGCISKSR